MAALPLYSGCNLVKSQLAKIASRYVTSMSVLCLPITKYYFFVSFFLSMCLDAKKALYVLGRIKVEVHCKFFCCNS